MSMAAWGGFKMKIQEFKNLQTKNLDLKPLVATFDFANYLFDMITNNKEFFKFMPFADVEKPEEEFDFLRCAEEKWRNLSSAQYGMYLRKTGEFVGVCSIFDLSKGRDSGEIGYWLDPKFSGRGLMSEAVMAVSDAFFEMGCHRIQIVANIKNIASCKTAEKCGFEREGIMRRYVFNKYLNENEDMALYAKIR